jgi:hypothetical protein
MGGNKMNKIRKLVSQKNWSLLVAEYSPKEICLSLNFREVMQLAKHLFCDDMHNDSNQQFCLKMVLEIKNHFKSEWEKDWKNDVFLGDLCSVLWLYDEQYACYKRAYDKLTDPPAALLLLIAGCQNAPGIPPITEEESESYLRKAVEKKITFETALMMRTLFERKGNRSQAEYWDQMYKKLEGEGVCSDLLIPDVLNE